MVTGMKATVTFDPYRLQEALADEMSEHWRHASSGVCQCGMSVTKDPSEVRAHMAEAMLAVILRFQQNDDTRPPTVIGPRCNRPLPYWAATAGRAREGSPCARVEGHEKRDTSNQMTPHLAEDGTQWFDRDPAIDKRAADARARIEPHYERLYREWRSLPAQDQIMATILVPMTWPSENEGYLFTRPVERANVSAPTVHVQPLPPGARQFTERII